MRDEKSLPVFPLSSELQQRLSELFQERLPPFRPHAAYDRNLDTLTILTDNCKTAATHPIADGWIELLFERTHRRIVGVKINGFSRLAARSNSLSAPARRSAE